MAEIAKKIWVPLYTLARELHKKQYNVLMFDYGYVNPSSNRLMTGGIQESQELLGAIDYIKQSTGGSIFIWGFSMGAGTALQTALQQNGDISGMILDSTFLLNSDTLYQNMNQVVHVPRYPSLPLVRLLFPLLNGVSLHDVPFTKVTTTSYEMPIFLIHGTNDNKAPHSLVEAMFKQQHNTASKLWILPNAQHELLYRAEPKTYVSRTMDFLRQYCTIAPHPSKLTLVFPPPYKIDLLMRSVFFCVLPVRKRRKEVSMRLPLINLSPYSPCI